MILFPTSHFLMRSHLLHTDSKSTQLLRTKTWNWNHPYHNLSNPRALTNPPPFLPRPCIESIRHPPLATLPILFFHQGGSFKAHIAEVGKIPRTFRALIFHHAEHGGFPLLPEKKSRRAGPHLPQVTSLE